MVDTGAVDGSAADRYGRDTCARFYMDSFCCCPVVILQLYIFCCGLGFLLADADRIFP